MGRNVSVAYKPWEVDSVIFPMLSVMEELSGICMSFVNPVQKKG